MPALPLKAKIISINITANFQIEVQRLALPKNNAIAIFDVHGTLLQSTWKTEYELMFWLLHQRVISPTWMNENIFGKERQESLLNIGHAFGADYDLPFMKEFQKKTRQDYFRFPAPTPYAIELIETLNRLDIPIYIISTRPTEFISGQLFHRGYFSGLLNPNQITGNITNGEGLESTLSKIKRQHPNNTLLLFDDYIYRIPAVTQADGISFSIIIGEGIEAKRNREAHIKAGTNYILPNGLKNIPELMGWMHRPAFNP